MMKRKGKAALISVVGDGPWQSVCSARKSWSHQLVLPRIVLSIVIVFYLTFMSDIGGKTTRFLQYCDSTAQQMSSPTILKMARGHDGRNVILDDGLQGYKWLAKNTPKDARVFAWWDYGYQITGIGERTSLADGNTWNHEHIATLGRLLSGSQKTSYDVIRHLADYVLIMTGAVNDDLSISPHFARIGNSVFPSHCGDDDPYCQKFGFHGQDRNQPTPMMKKSLVYNLYQHGKPGMPNANPRMFELVWKSKNDQMRFFKVVNVSEESRQWVASPENLLCDAPGSWYCVGQYPPAIAKFLSKRNSFAQVEDFNKQGAQSAYTKMINKQQHGADL